MIKQNKQISIPLAIIGSILIYCWLVFLTTEFIATWRQYLGLAFFLAIVIFFFKRFIATAIVATGIFLFLGTFNLLAITPSIDVVGISLFRVSFNPTYSAFVFGDTDTLFMVEHGLLD